MSENTKLQPEDLTAEERALWDALAVERVTRNSCCPERAYDFTDDWASRLILARRALFAPATEKAETTADRIAADLKAGTFRGAQPEPAAPEMPEAVRNASRALHRAAGFYQCEAQPVESIMRLVEAANTLESWWRTHSQPVAVGMTEELRAVIDFAADTCGMSPEEGWQESKLKEMRPLIQKVRQQAAQRDPNECQHGVEIWRCETCRPKPRARLEKAREFLKMTQDWMLTPDQRDARDAALAELDAAEGRK